MTNATPIRPSNGGRQSLLVVVSLSVFASTAFFAMQPSRNATQSVPSGAQDASSVRSDVESAKSPPAMADAASDDGGDAHCEDASAEAEPTDASDGALNRGDDGLESVGRATFIEFLLRYIRTYSETSHPAFAELSDAIRGEEFYEPADEEAEARLTRWGLVFRYAFLYYADVNHDGVRDYIFFDKNLVLDHADMLLGIFDAQGAALLKLSIPRLDASGINGFPEFVDAPFLRRTADGIEMHFFDQWPVNRSGNPVSNIDPAAVGFKETHTRYLWKCSTMRAIEERTARPSQ